MKSQHYVYSQRSPDVVIFHPFNAVKIYRTQSDCIKYMNGKVNNIVAPGLLHLQAFPTKE